jgi:RpiR family transcriptional regulator, carbohydrate utilization regulator
MLDRIRASLTSLAPAEQRVGKLVLADPRAFTNLPVSELADRSHVSKPTVVRFCRSMGYDGLTDFKRKLAGSVSEGVPFIHRSVDADDKYSDVLVKVIDNTVAAFLKYRNDASTSAIEKAADAMVQAYRDHKRIEFYGVGNSGIVAQDAQHKFFRLGVNAIAYSDGHMLQFGPHARFDGCLRHCPQKWGHHHHHHHQRHPAGASRPHQSGGRPSRRF